MSIGRGWYEDCEEAEPQEGSLSKLGSDLLKAKLDEVFGIIADKHRRSRNGKMDTESD